jgi:Zn-dependent protease with chaperone function
VLVLMTREVALALARSEVAWWVPWWPLVLAGLVAVVGRVLAQAIVRHALAEWRRVPAAAHWTERARVAFRLRRMAYVGLLASPLFGAVVAAAGPLAIVPPRVTIALCAFAGALAIQGVFQPVNDALGAPRSRTSTVGTVGLLLLLVPTLPVLLVVGVVLVRIEDTVSALLAWLLGGLLLAGWLRALPVALRSLGPRIAAPERLRQVVVVASDKIGMRAPATFVVPLQLANAIAYPTSGVLVLTRPALDVLDDAALEAVVLHELGHLREPPLAIAYRVLRVVNVYALALGGIVGRFDRAAPFVLVGVVWVVAILARGQSVRLERAADAVALAHADEGAYARALECLCRANLSPVVTRSGGTHPHAYDRLVAAGVTPDYPRPAPPESSGSVGFGLLLLVGGLALGLRMALATYATGDLAIAATGDAVSHATALRSVAPARAIPYDALALDAWHSMEARDWLAYDQAQAGLCSDAEMTMASGPVSRELSDWVATRCR